MSFVVGSSYTKALKWLAAHARIQRKKHKVIIDGVNKTNQQIKNDVQPKSDKHKPPIVDDLFKDEVSEKLNQFNMQLHEFDDDLNTAVARLEYIDILDKKLQEASNAIYQKIDEIRTTTLTVAYDVANDIEANTKNENGSLKGIEERLMEDHLKFRTKMTGEIAFLERQAETNNTNMNTLKDAVNEALGHLTNGKLSINLDLGTDADSDSDDDSEEG